MSKTKYDIIASDFLSGSYEYWLSEVWKGWVGTQNSAQTYEEFLYGNSSWWINETCLDLHHFSDVAKKYTNFWSYLEDVRKSWTRFRQHVALRDGYNKS